MGVFETDKIVAGVGPVDMDAALAEVRATFEAKEYSVKTERLASGGGHLSLTKGGTFQSVLGLATALNVKIEPRGRDWHVSTSVGIFGQQAIPTLLTVFVAWPVLLPQAWGLVQQSQLDEAAVAAVEVALRGHAQPAAGPTAPGGLFCTGCGAPTPAEARFCARCGQRT